MYAHVWLSVSEHHVCFKVCIFGVSVCASVYVLVHVQLGKKKGPKPQVEQTQRSWCVFQEGASGWHQERLEDW